MTAPDVTSRWDRSAAFGAGGLPEDATGTVTFTFDGGEICVAAASGGHASCTTDLRPEVGTRDVGATYSGDASYAGTTTHLAWTVSSVRRLMSVSVPDRVVRDHRARLLVRLRSVDPCSPYVACRAGGDEGVLRWTVTRAGGGVRCTRRTVVEDGRARWRTPRLPRRGTYYVQALYDGGPHFKDADQHDSFRVTRR
jgi:hypothetical protein